MKTSTRFAILIASMSLCAGGILITAFGSERIDSGNFEFVTTETIVAADGYQFAASRIPKLTFQQLEIIIRRDPVAKA